jgi:hypothetical protein
MIDKFAAIKGLSKLTERIGKIFGEKRVDKFLLKRKGLGKSRGHKIVDYAWRKPASTQRRIKRINTALNVAPYVATGAGAVGIMSMMSSSSKENKKRNKKLKTYFGTLPKSDPRYQSLKKGGYV